MPERRLFDSIVATVTLPTFGGKGDVRPFIASLDKYFEAEDIPEMCYTAIARRGLKPDVRHTIDRLAKVVEKLLKKPWIWTWARLRVALTEIYEQIEDERRKRRGKLMRSAALGSAIAAGAPVLFVGLLRAIGFRSGAADATAIVVRPAIIYDSGHSALPSSYQTAVIGGAALAFVNSSAAFGVAAGAMSAATARTPSASWDDGKSFKPCRKLLEAMLSLESEGRVEK